MPLSATYEQLQARYQRSRLPGFLAWWSGQLATFVPPAWRRVLARGESRLLLRPTDGAVEVLASRDGALSLRMRVANAQLLELNAGLAERRDARERWLVMPGARVLRRPLSLPLAAAPRVRDVLVHEIDRQTPFAADQVAFDWRVLSRDEDAGKLNVELVAVPLDRLDAEISALGPLASSLSGVDVEVDGRVLGVNLMPPARRSSDRHTLAWVHLALLAVFVIGAWFMLWQSLENRREAVAELQAVVDQRQVEARRVAALREQLDTAAGGATFLAGMREARPRVLEVIDELSRRLPDGTWLERLTINQGRVVLQGLSNEAAGTIGWLQASPYLADPAFTGAVQPDPRSGAQRFTLTADLRVPEAQP